MNIIIAYVILTKMEEPQADLNDESHKTPLAGNKK